MRTYFIAANLWAAIAFVVFLGRHTERTNPTMYSFFGVGGSYYPGGYAMLIALPSAVAVACLMLFLRSQPSFPPQR